MKNAATLMEPEHVELPDHPALEHDGRSELYKIVSRTPGIHLGELARELGMETSSVLWHARKLERANLVRSQRSGKFRVFYPVAGGVEAKRMAATRGLINSDNAQRICSFVDAHPGATANDLATRLAINVTTVRWHLRRLAEFGLVAGQADGVYRRYFVPPNVRDTLPRRARAGPRPRA